MEQKYVITSKMIFDGLVESIFEDKVEGKARVIINKAIEVPVGVSFPRYFHVTKEELIDFLLDYYADLGAILASPLGFGAWPSLEHIDKIAKNRPDLIKVREDSNKNTY